jgi:heme exporter protein D|nr:hypothetical protein 13 [Desulfobacterales bacterium]
MPKKYAAIWYVSSLVVVALVSLFAFLGLQSTKTERTPLEEVASQLGVELEVECYESSFGKFCNYADTPLSGPQLRQAMTMVGECEQARLTYLVHQKHLVLVQSVTEAQASCAAQAKKQAAQDRMDKVRTEQAQAIR